MENGVKMKINKTLFRILFLNLFLYSFIGCARVHIIETIPRGVHKARILIRSQPTKAKIYIDDQYLGITPIKTDLWYAHDTSINIKAEPMYPNQIPQNIYLRIPPIPDKMTIYMDFKPKISADLEEEEEDIPDKIIVEKVPIIQRMPYAFPIIYFDFDKANFQEEEKWKVHEITDILDKNSTYILAIHGYCDERGTYDYNIDLSTRRANSVYNYLVKTGVNPMQLKIFAHGEIPTLTDEGVELEFRHNRIVYFKLYQKPEEPPIPDEE